PCGPPLVFAGLAPCRLFVPTRRSSDLNGAAVFTNRSVDCGTSNFNDFGPFDVTTTGTYTLTVGGLGSNDDSTGPYSFAVRGVPAAGGAAVSTEAGVSDGCRELGAGNIE